MNECIFEWPTRMCYRITIIRVLASIAVHVKRTAVVGSVLFWFLLFFFDRTANACVLQEQCMPRRPPSGQLVCTHTLQQRAKRSACTTLCVVKTT